VSCNPSHLICPLDWSSQFDRLITKGFVLLSTDTGELKSTSRPSRLSHAKREKEIS